MQDLKQTKEYYNAYTISFKLFFGQVSLNCAHFLCVFKRYKVQHNRLRQDNKLEVL